MLAACHEADKFANSLALVTLPAGCTQPVERYASLLGKSPKGTKHEHQHAHDAVVFTIAQALMLSQAPTGFNNEVDPGRLAAESLRHANAADTMVSMFKAMPRTTKCADQLRAVVLLLVLTSPKHSIHDVDRIYHQFCNSQGGTTAPMNHKIEADACVFLAKSLRTFARLMMAVPSQLAHVVELNADSKAIPAVLQSLLSHIVS